MYILITLVSELLLKMIFNWQLNIALLEKSEGLHSNSFQLILAIPARLHVDIPNR